MIINFDTPCAIGLFVFWLQTMMVWNQ